MSDFNNFLFNSDEWEFYKNSTKGVSADDGAIWLKQKSNPSIKALFKPNPEFDQGLNLAQIEYETAQIAEQLNIEHARTEVIEYNGQIGVLSYNTKDPNYKYQDISEFTKSQGFPKPKSNSPMNTSGISLTTLRQKYPELVEDTVNMLFLDCLTRNGDRHSENWEVKLDEKGNRLGLCPLFDFDDTLNPNRTQNKCKVIYSDGDKDFPTHYEMFEHLVQENTMQINCLLQKANKIQNLNPVAEKQCSEMNNIWTKFISKNFETRYDNNSINKLFETITIENENQDALSKL